MEEGSRLACGIGALDAGHRRNSGVERGGQHRQARRGDVCDRASSRVAEVIVVDDASTDATGAEIKALIEGGNCAGLHYLRHDHRSGQSAAMRSGILVATSPIIATMDGDGQNDPRDIPRLLEVLAAPGSDDPALVGGVRTERKATGSKRWASRAADWIRDMVLQDGAPTPAAGSRFTGARCSCGCRSSPACTATCQPCSRLTATR